MIHPTRTRDPIKDNALLNHGTLAEAVSALFSHCQTPAMGYGSPGRRDRAAHSSTPQPHSAKMRKAGQLLPSEVTHLRKGEKAILRITKQFPPFQYAFQK